MNRISSLIDKDIIKFIKANSGKSGIIYCLSRKKVEELAEILKANGEDAYVLGEIVKSDEGVILL